MINLCFQQCPYSNCSFYVGYNHSNLQQPTSGNIKCNTFTLEHICLVVYIHIMLNLECCTREPSRSLTVLIVFSLYHIFKIQFLGLSVMASGLFLNKWRPTTVRQRLEDPPSLTEFHLSISKSSSKDSLLNTLNLGVLLSIQIVPRDKALCVDLGGKVRAIITPHSPGQPKVYSPRNAYMLVKSK